MKGEWNVKKLISVLCGAVTAVSMAAPALAAFSWTSEITDSLTVYEDFASDTVAQIKNKENWSKSGPNSPSYQNGVLSFTAGASGESKDTSATRTFEEISATDNMRYAVMDLDFKLNSNVTGMMIYVKGGSDVTRLATTLSNGKVSLWTNAGNDDGSAASSKHNIIDDVEISKWYTLSVVYDLTEKKADYYVDNKLVLEDKNYYNNNNESGLKSILFAAGKNSGVSYDIRSLKIGKISDKLATYYDSCYSAINADLTHITADITLPTKTKYGSSVVWTSSNPDVLSSSGTVDLAKADPSGESVTLTAEYTLNDESYTCEYTATVYGATKEDWSIFEDFAADAPTNIKNKVLSSGKGKWDKSGTQSPKYNGGVLYVSSVAGDAKDTRATLTITEPVASDIAVVSFDFKLAAGSYPLVQTYGTDKKMISNIMSRVTDDVTELCLFDKDNKACLADENGNEYVLMTNPDNNTSYTITMIYDFTNNTVDYYINDILKYLGVKLCDEATGDEITNIAFGAQNKGATSVNISNLRIASFTDKVKIHDTFYTDSDKGVIAKPAKDAVSYLNAVVRKPADDTSNIGMYLAVYGSDGSLVKVFNSEYTLTADQKEETLRLEIDGKLIPENGTYKAFVWKSNTLTPMVIATEDAFGNAEKTEFLREPYAGADATALAAYNGIEDRKANIINDYYAKPSVSLSETSS